MSRFFFVCAPRQIRRSYSRIVAVVDGGDISRVESAAILSKNITNLVRLCHDGINHDDCSLIRTPASGSSCPSQISQSTLSRLGKAEPFRRNLRIQLCHKSIATDLHMEDW